MRLRWGQKNLTPIGVDFGHDTLKLLQIVTEDPPQLVAAASTDVPTDARRSADAYRTFATQALRDMMRETRFRGKRAIVSISAARSYLQHVRVPKSDGSIQEQQIEAELQSRLPLEPSGLVIRHFPVTEVVSEGQSRQELICLAASRELIMRQVQTARTAGLDVVGMHGEPLAVLEAFSHLFRREGDEGKTTFFIDIGAATTKALIAHGKRVVFAKTIHVGGDHFTRQYAEQHGLEFSDARVRRAQGTGNGEAAKAEPGGQATAGEGLESDGDSVKTLNETATSTESATAATTAPAAGADGDEMVEALIDELQLCVGYHNSIFPDRAIDKAIFLGGEARQTETCQRIARALQLPAQRADPLARLVRPRGAGKPNGTDLRSAQPGWAVPLGLCLLPTNL